VKAGGAVGFGLELCGLGGGEEVGVEEGGTEEGPDVCEGFGRREISGDVARGVAPDEGQVRTGLQRDRADEEILQRGVGGGDAGFAKGEFDEGAGGDGSGEEGEEAVAGRHGRHVMSLTRWARGRRRDFFDGARWRRRGAQISKPFSCGK
jgi:hypothetical protein